MKLGYNYYIFRENYFFLKLGALGLYIFATCVKFKEKEGREKRFYNLKNHMIIYNNNKKIT